MSQLRMSASRLGAMVGADPRMSRLALFRELQHSDYDHARDAGKLSGNEAIDSGILFEKPIAELACQRYDMEMVEGPQTLTTQDELLVGHPDRYVLDENKEKSILEVKLIFHVPEDMESQWGPPGTDQVPVHYYLQALAYAMMAGLKRSHLAAWIAGVGVRRYTIERNEAVEAKLMEDVRDMMRRVKEDNPPDPLDEADMRLRWFADNEKIVEVDTEFVEWAKAHYLLGQQIRAAEKERSGLNTLMLGTMQDAGLAVHEGTKIMSAKNNRFFLRKEFELEQAETAMQYQKLDTTRLRKEQKALYETYMAEPADVTEATRVLRPLKALKGLCDVRDDGSKEP